MDNSQPEQSAFELLIIPQEALAQMDVHEEMDSQGFPQLLRDAEVAGQFGEQVRRGFEEITGKPVVSSENFLDQPKRKKPQLPTAKQESLFDHNQQE